ncbi:hypothetical protein [Streptomyces sp900129855]|uniref:Uncharacterized protein n=1 Tax=Streptomyces sp. 900129855 TaxID=3155129 RepID=A0ABV2ZK94_9ACTN
MLRAAEDAFGAPCLQVHRADPHHALAAALPAEPGALRLDTVVVGPAEAAVRARHRACRGGAVRRLRARTAPPAS